jgi:hypothetical protein
MIAQTYGGNANYSWQEYITLIANALGEGWSRGTKYDDTDCDRRAVIVGPNSQELFLFNTRAAKGRLYISGSLPQGCDWPYKADRPDITVAITKCATDVAKDITRRLLPRYAPILAKALEAKRDRDNFEAVRAALAAEVAAVVGGRVQGQMVYSKGWDLQVSGPELIRIYGNCNYLTLDQLTKIKDACPELFTGKGEL